MLIVIMFIMCSLLIQYRQITLACTYDIWFGGMLVLKR